LAVEPIFSSFVHYCVNPLNPKAFMKKFILFIGAVLFAGAANADTTTITVDNMQFNPASPSIHEGDVIVWDFQEADHTTTSGSECNPDGKWDSKTVAVGQTFAFKFTTSGTYPYFCKNHCSSMQGVIHVDAATGVQSQPATVQKKDLMNYPNPFTGTTSFSFYAEKSGKGVLDIYTVEGKKMASMDITTVSGLNTVPVSLDLAKGTYVARLSLEATLPEYKLIVKQQ
jgi:plastocyanin